MKFFTLLFLALWAFTESTNAQQLKVKCGNNAITIDSAAQVQKYFFEYDSISFIIPDLQGEYSLSFAKLSKKNPPMVFKGTATNDKPFKLYSTFVTVNYDDAQKLIIVVSKNDKFVKSYRLILNLSVDSYK